MKQGICTKCGKEGKVVMHHAHGYEGENKDNVQPYCSSCHVLIHKEARKSGRCQISPKELDRISTNSCQRRIRAETMEYINFYETLLPNVKLFEQIQVYPNRITYHAMFQAFNNKQLLEILC